MLEFLQDIKEELEVVEEELREALQAPDPLITEVSTHLLKAGGKRLRPALSLLGGKCYNFDFKRVLPLAVALELIHMATLVHDDVVDSSTIRRGVRTVKALWGNKISVHVGNYLFARSLILISSYEEPLISRVLANTARQMCEGEIEQISTCFNVEQAAKDYFNRIKRKTALLIAASCQLGAVACKAPRKIYEPLRRYGYHIGMAFQITDDILDIVADEQLLGKPVGSDLRQGIITLPVIYALKHSPQRKRLKDLVLCRDKNNSEIYQVCELVRECGGIAFSSQVAQKYVRKARRELALLPDRPAKNTLALIADFISMRKF